MLDYQKNAINQVRAQAATRQDDTREVIKTMLEPLGIQTADLVALLLNRPITVNFHPDRLTRANKSVIESLIDEGKYQGQFLTQTTNGSDTAYIGGERFNWEQRLFCEAYPPDALERPKYGALNIFNYRDGGAMRFGSCYFVLKQSVVNRCTFSYGDSAIGARGLCSSDTFESLLMALLLDIRDNQKMLNQVAGSMEEAIATLVYDWRDKAVLGRNLDYYIETHIHGDIDLAKDVESLFLDSAFKGTALHEQAKALCNQYSIALAYIPKRTLNVDAIGPLFRGPTMQMLAKRISALYGISHNTIDAYSIGKASCDSIKHYADWKAFGSEAECFQYMKQLWHMVGYFG